MIYKQHKNEFGDIGTVVYYTRNISSENSIPRPFPLDVEDDSIPYEVGVDSRGVKILYHISDLNLSNLDFAEYDFDFIINKSKYNDTNILNFLTQTSKDLIGKETSDLDKINTALFPTVVSSEEESRLEYFGSTKIQNQVFYLFNVPENVIKIEFYEGSIEKNYTCDIVDLETIKSVYFDGGMPSFIDYDFFKLVGPEEYIVEPVLSIYLGPDYYDSNNTEDMYYSEYYSQAKEKFEVKTDYKTWLTQKDEARCSKIVWLLFSSDNSISEINLAYNSWINNINPERNKKNYSIRNDEWFSTRESLSNIKEVSGLNDAVYTYDAASGTLLGTKNEVLGKENSSKGILSSKLKKISKIKNLYSPYVEYEKGDIVYYGTRPDKNIKGVSGLTEYISLCNHNQGNNPLLSYMWSRKSALSEDIFTQTVNIYPNPVGSGTITPNIITLTSATQTAEFNIQESPGYSYDNCYIEKTGTTKIASTSSYTESAGNYVRRVVITDWSKVFNKSTSVFFNFIAEGTNLTFTGIYETTSSEFSITTKTTTGDVNVGSLVLETITDIATNSDLTKTDNSGKINIATVSIGDSGVKYSISGLTNKFNISEVVQTYRIGGEDYTRNLDFTIDNSNNIIITDPYILTYQSANIAIKVIDETVNIAFYPSDLYETSFESINVTYGSDSEFKFIIADGYTLTSKDSGLGGIVFYNNENAGEYFCLDDTNIILDSDSDETKASKIVTDSNSYNDESTFELRKQDNIYTVSIKNLVSNYKIQILVK